ncbi:MAG: DUF4302 domain-containing protein [Polaribacter sp.]
MKYLKKLNWQILSLLIFVSIYSCQNNDNPDLLFSDVPSVRFNKEVKKVQDFLIAADNGWKITYFTDNTMLGGYTLLFDFINETEVKMDSDFGNPDPSKISLYGFSLGSTLKLSFTTKNVIHELSDGDNYPDGEFEGKGYKGDFEFLFSSFDGEDIIFRSNRDPSNYIRFKKATAEDRSNFSKNDDIRKEIYGQFIYKINGVTNTFNYNEARRFAINVNSDVNDTNFGVGFTPKGIIVSPAITAENGKVYGKFTLNAKKDKLVSEDGEFSIFIFKSSFNPNQDWKINATSTGGVSATFLDSFAEISDASIANRGWQIRTVIDFGNTTFNDVTTPGISIFSFNTPTRTTGFYGTFNLSFAAIAGKPNQLDVSRLGFGINWRFFTYFDPLVDLITDNSPYKAELTPATDPTVVKLTSVANPDVWFTIRI